MRAYSKDIHFSVSMTNLSQVSEIIKNENKKNRIRYVIETGTNLGLGSTKMLAETFINEEQPPEIITLEANWLNWKKAKKNLEKYNFVKPFWGLSVSKDKAVDFVKNDYAILHHQEFPDIYIDGGDDPKGFYEKELSGEFGYTRFKLVNLIFKYFENRDKKKYFGGEDLLKKFVSKYKKEVPLILLDSAGGIGLLEFKIVTETMGSDPYYLLLDDINHLKHFRSFKEIKENPSFTILAENVESGWVFAKSN
jgi:hypothetical protein